MAYALRIGPLKIKENGSGALVIGGPLGVTWHAHHASRYLLLPSEGSRDDSYR